MDYLKQIVDTLIISVPQYAFLRHKDVLNTNNSTGGYMQPVNY